MFSCGQRPARRAQEQLAILDELSKKSKETAIKVTPRVRGLANGLKNRVGQLEGVRKGGLLEKKKLAEQALLAWIEGGALAGAGPHSKPPTLGGRREPSVPPPRSRRPAASTGASARSSDG